MSWSCGSGPDLYEDMTEPEREARAVLTPDICVIDDRYFFLRGQIEIPVRGRKDHFVWIVWVSLSEASFRSVVDNWEHSDRTRSGPFFGWLCTHLPYPATQERLKTTVHIRPRGEIPLVELERTDHPLATEQRDGISIGRVTEIAEAFLPQH